MESNGNDDDRAGGRKRGGRAPLPDASSVAPRKNPPPVPPRSPRRSVEQADPAPSASGSVPPSYPPPPIPSAPGRSKGKEPASTWQRGESSTTSSSGSPRDFLNARAGASRFSPLWSAEQNAAFERLSERLDKVVTAFGRLVDVATASEEETIFARELDKNRPKFDGMGDTLQAIQKSKTLDARGRQRAADGEFEVIQNLEATVSAIQKRYGIADDGVRDMPPLTHEQSKAYGELTDRLQSTVKLVDRAKGAPGAAKVPSDLAKGVAALSKDGAKLAGLENELASAQGEKAQGKAAKALLDAMAGIDKKVELAETQLKAYRSLTPKPERDEPSLLRRAVGKIAGRSKDQDNTPAGFSISTPTVNSEKTQFAAAPAPIRSGPPEHEIAKPGGSVGGRVAEISLADGNVNLKIGVPGHQQSLIVPESSGVGRAIEKNVRAGDDVSLSFATDPAGGQVAHVVNRTTGQDVSVNRDGATERPAPPPRPARTDRGI